MAEEQNNTQERTEQPTERRKQEARKKGQVPRSKELNIMLSLLFAAFAFLVMGNSISAQISSLFESALTIERALVFDKHAIALQFVGMVLDSIWLLLPFFAVMIVGALAGPLVMGGWAFSPAAMAFKWEKISPLAGLKRVFSAKGLMELLKALFKFFVLLAVTGVLFWLLMEEILALGILLPVKAFGDAAGILQWSFLFLSAAMLTIVVVDVPFEVWNHNRQLKMTRREVLDEMKESEGRPEVKSRIRQLQREASQHRMMEAAKTADVVITNPTHFAVALKYDSTKTRAPLVLAKGADLVALKIRSIAVENDIAIFEAPPLARALFSATDIGEEIPENLYLAVARVLAYVYQLRTARRGEPAERPDDLPVPPEYLNLNPQPGATADE